METTLKWVVVVGGALFDFLYGGWTALLGVLFALVVIDYATGWMAGAARGELKSKVGFIGIARKIAIGLLVACAHFVDVALATGDMARDAVVIFYVANELLSIIENLGRLGVPVPAVLANAVEVLKKKGGNKNV